MNVFAECIGHHLTVDNKNTQSNRKKKSKPKQFVHFELMYSYTTFFFSFVQKTPLYIAHDYAILITFIQFPFLNQFYLEGSENVDCGLEGMLWDSCGGTLDTSLGFVEIEHRCYKDEKIKKVFKPSDKF